MSSLVSHEHARRLERARLQYENLLIHAGEVLIEKEADMKETFNTELNYSSSPVRRSRDVRFQSPLFERTVNQSYQHDDSLAYEGGGMTDQDKDSIIVSLQEEVDRLRRKLDTVVSSVEAVIQDAQAAQDEIKEEHDREVETLRLKYSRLEDENNQLRVTLDLSQAQLAVEQDNLLKAARFIERLKRRGREYTDVQRKSNALLVTTSAIASTAGGRVPGRDRRVSLPSAAEEEAQRAERGKAGSGAGEGYDGEQEVGTRSTVHMFPASASKKGSGVARR